MGGGGGWGASSEGERVGGREGEGGLGLGS